MSVNLKTIDSIYFLGIGGIGMSALARYFNFEGRKVAGYDRTSSPLTNELEGEGISIHFTDSIDLIPSDTQLVIYTPAIPKDNSEFQHLLDSEVPMLKRSEILGEISKDYFTIAIAGTHGKTTTTSILAHIMKDNGIPVNAFIGGIANNFNSNLVLSKDAKVMVVEADEFDRSFLTLHPNVAIITSMDADHLDIYSSHDYLKESFFLFSEQIKNDGWLISQQKLDVASGFNGKLITYAAVEEADYSAINLEVKKGRTCFDINKIEDPSIQYSLSMPGSHNVENALAAVVAASIYGLNNEQIARSIQSYTGVKRRFEYLIHSESLVMIDDYAHHPAEIKATILATRTLFPDKKITAVFQPHLFSRTRDFMDDFAESLSMADDLILLDIYPARELPIEGVSSVKLLEKVNLTSKQLLSKDALVEVMNEKEIEVLLMMGAGDIDRLLEPVKQRLLR